MCCWLGVIANLGLRVIESNFNSLELWPFFGLKRKVNFEFAFVST